MRQLIDSDGVVSLGRSYPPYGEVLESEGSGETSYGFTNEYTDNTGLVYLRSRYYAPSQGRFISHDTWLGSNTRPVSYNAWLYVYGNPVNKTDPSGMYPYPPEGGGGSDYSDTYPPNCNRLTGEDYLICEKIIRGINPDENLSLAMIRFLGYIRDCPGNFVHYFTDPRIPQSYDNDTKQYGIWYHWLSQKVSGWWNEDGHYYADNKP